MAYDTYAGLKTTVADWLHRANLTSQIPDFINLAERTINRRLNIFPRELEIARTGVTGNRFVPLPTDFGQPVALYLNDVQPREELTIVLANQLFVNTAASLRPRYWAVDGSNIAFESPCDLVYPMVLRYQQNVFLSDAAPTHATFARYPDLYLYGALAEAAPYVRDDARWPTWDAKFKELMREAAQDASMSKAAAELRTEIPDILRRPYFDGRSYT